MRRAFEEALDRIWRGHTQGDTLDVQNGIIEARRLYDEAASRAVTPEQSDLEAGPRVWDTEDRAPREIMHGFRMSLLYDPDANGNTKWPDRLSDEMIEDIADFLAERGLFGWMEITTVDDAALHSPPCRECAEPTVTPEQIEAGAREYAKWSTDYEGFENVEWALMDDKLRDDYRKHARAIYDAIVGREE